MDLPENSTPFSGYEKFINKEKKYGKQAGESRPTGAYGIRNDNGSFYGVEKRAVKPPFSHQKIKLTCHSDCSVAKRGIPMVKIRYITCWAESLSVRNDDILILVGSLYGFLNS